VKKSELKRLINEEVISLIEVGIREKDVCSGSKVCYGWGRATTGSLQLKYDNVKYVLRNQVKLESGRFLYLSDNSFVGREDRIRKHLDWCMIK